MNALTWSIGDVKITVTPTMPVGWYLPPIALPTEAGIGFAGELGRNFDICIDMPLELTDEDQQTLRRLARQINRDTEDNDPGKFQKRAGRLLDYADVRIPGSSPRTDSNPQEGRRSRGEFDRADAAIDALMDHGLGETTEGLGVFRDSNIQMLLASMDLPAEVSNFMNDPEQMFDRLPDFTGGVDSVTCDDLGVSPGMRDRSPRLDSVCAFFDDLPSFDTVTGAFERIEGLPDELLDGIAALMEPLLDLGEPAKDEIKDTGFCDTKVGKKKAFDNFCER